MNCQKLYTASIWCRLWRIFMDYVHIHSLKYGLYSLPARASERMTIFCFLSMVEKRVYQSRDKKREMRLNREICRATRSAAAPAFAELRYPGEPSKTPPRT